MTILNRVFLALSLLSLGCASKDVAPAVGPLQSPMPVVSKYVEEYGALSSPIIDEYIQNILALAGQYLPHPSSKAFSVSLLDTGKPIAFTPGGGFILISTGLVRHLKVEGEFLFVIAHEIAHEVLGHTSSENFYSKDPKARETLELQADQFAAMMLARAGYDPGISLRALKDAYEDLTEEQYSSVYPSQEIRAASIRRFLSELPFSSAEKDNDAFKKFKRSLS